MLTAGHYSRIFRGIPQSTPRNPGPRVLSIPSAAAQHPRATPSCRAATGSISPSQRPSPPAKIINILSPLPYTLTFESTQKPVPATLTLRSPPIFRHEGFQRSTHTLLASKRESLWRSHEQRRWEEEEEEEEEEMGELEESEEEEMVGLTSRANTSPEAGSAGAGKRWVCGARVEAVMRSKVARLVKPDLLLALQELQRQQQWCLATRPLNPSSAPPTLPPSRPSAKASSTQFLLTTPSIQALVRMECPPARPPACPPTLRCSPLTAAPHCFPTSRPPCHRHLHFSQVFEHVRTEHWYKPDADLCAHMINCLGLAGRITDAQALFQATEDEDGMPPCSPTYTALLTAHFPSGDYRSGREVLGRMREARVGPYDAAYMILIKTCEAQGDAGAAAERDVVLAEWGQLGLPKPPRRSKKM
ncbi:unnamed protein product [Closterium sp. NIES-53]